MKEEGRGVRSVISTVLVFYVSRGRPLMSTHSGYLIRYLNHHIESCYQCTGPTINQHVKLQNAAQWFVSIFQCNMNSLFMRQCLSGPVTHSRHILIHLCKVGTVIALVELQKEKILLTFITINIGISKTSRLTVQQ
jgi:hypothetical protein